MAYLDQTKKNKIQRNLTTLDYMQGTGMISESKRKLSDEVFLFISSGGTGHKTLKTLRQRLERCVDADELQRKVRFLAIDAAWAEIDQLVNEDGFTESEVVRLPWEGAHESISPANLASSPMKTWVDPELYRQTGGEAGTRAANSGFDNTGAGAWRQPGRVRLCQPNTINTLQNAITTAAKALFTNNTSALSVFFLAGIAGGTGSGTIVDLPFITRHIIRELNSTRYTNSKFSAYLLLPDACGSAMGDDAVKGNRNAVAALKEIDYYMGMRQRDEVFEMNYGTAMSVRIPENIFDFCTLVGGVAAGGRFFADPAETARTVTANSILNLIAVPENKQLGGKDIFLVDSFLSNFEAQAADRVRAHSSVQWPRSRNYSYSIIGYSSCTIPRDLMTVYVAKKVFDRMWAVFQENSGATVKAAESFLEKAHLEPDDARNARSDSELLAAFNAEADRRMRKYGPYYMINLMKRLNELFITLANECRSKDGKLLAGKNWGLAARRYGALANLAAEQNDRLYEVYTFVIEELKRLIDSNAKLLTDTEEHQSLFGKSFSWSPVDLTPGHAANNAIARYLDNLFDEEDIYRKAGAFVDSLVDKKDEWTQLDPPNGGSVGAFDSARVIRDFMRAQFRDIVDGTMELFLVKLYSGDEKAVLPTLPENQDPQGWAPLHTAANTLVQWLSDNSEAMCPTATGFLLADCYRNVYITLPDGCKKLKTCVEQAAAGLPNENITADNIYESSSQDEIVMYRLYSGVPAWALTWLAQAEPHYEQSPNACGLHMEHGANGHDWSRYPDPGLYTCPRRSELAAKAAALMTRAEDLGLLVRTNPDAVGVPPEYDVLYLAGKATAEELFAVLAAEPGKSLDPAAVPAALKTAGKLSAKKLFYANQVLTAAPTVAADFDMEAFSRQLICEALPRQQALWDWLDTTIPVMDELYALVAAHNGTASLAAQAQARRGTFIDAWLWGLVTYNRLRKTWYTQDGPEKPLGAALDGKLRQECSEYFGAQQFFALGADRYDELADALRDAKEQADDARLEQIEARAAAYKAEMKTKVDLKRSDEVSFPMASIGFEEEARSRGEDPDAIRDFYAWLVKQL